ncbi:unnamed protein product [Toxocara canis]|uniref:RRM domain-containing protein n=1 Tax=Toxocara canis TaxID=6265 RepID=A0A3P7EU27_TOXCA|nr:unnamed protein product [Toxocara canis]
MEEKQPSSSIDNDNETVKGQSLEKETLSKEEKKKIRRTCNSKPVLISSRQLMLQITGFLDDEAVCEVKREPIEGHEEGKINEQTETRREAKKEEEEVEDGDAVDDDDEQGPSAGKTVFVKNLNFDTSDEALFKKFSSKFKIRSAIVSRKRDPSDPAKSLSMGFGFLKNVDCLAVFRGILLDGHCLELKLSHREEAADESRKRKTVSRLEQGESTKIMVRNIPFQATRKEVKQLFATFGELRAFRMPKKMMVADSRRSKADELIIYSNQMGSSAEGHRGFGFVDFLTRADARRAFDALVHSTHIYGRRLVLEWAKVEESIEELREKALSSLSGETKELRNQKKRMKEIEKDLTVIDDD